MTSTQVAISLDTTGSMVAALTEVRTRITEMICSLKRNIPGIQLAVVAHGDYCDADTYVTKHQDFTDNETKLVEFVRNVKQTGGGDTPECYELVLRLVRTKLSWKRGSEKILVVVGDAYPHPPDYPQNKDRIDWKEEARLLAGMPMRIYGVQIDSDPTSTAFFHLLTQTTGGSHLKLTEFSTLTDVVLAVCYRSRGTENLKKLEKEVRARYAPKPLHKDLEEVFTVLHRPRPVPTVKAQTKSSPHMYRGKDISFTWGGKVTSSQPLSWTVPDNDDDSVHKLQVQLAILGSEAKAYEANIVKMETTNFQDERISQPIVHMVSGKDTMVSVGLSFNSPVTFHLTDGEGPVYLSGQHVAIALQEEREGDKAEGEVESGKDSEGGDDSSEEIDPFRRSRSGDEGRSSGDSSGHTTDKSEGKSPSRGIRQSLETTDRKSDCAALSFSEDGFVCPSVSVFKDGSDGATLESEVKVHLFTAAAPEQIFDDCRGRNDRSDVFEQVLQSAFAKVGDIFGRH